MVSASSKNVEIPVYSAEDWNAIKKEPTFMDRYGAYIVIAACILLAAAVLLIAGGIRKKVR